MESNTDREKARSQAQHRKAWEELTQSYLADLPEQLQAMRLCLAQGDLANLKLQAHRAKGTSGTYRLKNISEQLARLESLALQDAAQDIAPLLDRLATLVDEATERVTQ